MSKKKLLELQKQAKEYTDQVIKRLDSDAKVKKEIIELHNKIADLRAELAERAVPEESKKRRREKYPVKQVFSQLRNIVSLMVNIPFISPETLVLKGRNWKKPPQLG